MSVDSQVELLKNRLKHWTPRDDKNAYAICPVHGDSNPSLLVTKGDSGKVLIHCCSQECSPTSILKAIGLQFVGDEIKASGPGPQLQDEDKTPVELHLTDILSWKVVATYTYTDGQGNEVLKVERRESDTTPRRKAFFQLTQDALERWVMKVLPGTQLPPYNYDAILAHPNEPIYVVEGEKAAEALIRQGLLATTNPGGAGKWSRIAPQYRQSFNNRHVIILPDADTPGRQHATDVALDLEGHGAASIKVVELYPGENSKKDAFDYLKTSNVKDIQSKVLRAPVWRMDPATTGFDLPSGAQFVSLAHPSISLRGREFLVPGVIMSGSLALLAGKGSAGKSSLCGHLAAAITNGLPAFGLDAATDYLGKVPKGNVIWVSKEEGPETELAARLVSEGAALERVFILREGNLNLDNTEEVDRLLNSRRPLMIILDPLTSYIGGDENSNKGVRATLENLLQAIHRAGLQTVILGLVHMNKSGKDDEADVNKVLGSVGLPNLSRSTLMVRKNPEGSRELAIAKANFRAREDNLLFGIVSLEEQEGLRVIEASGMTVATDKRQVVKSMCRVVIQNWVKPETSKERSKEMKCYADQILKVVADEAGLSAEAIADLLDAQEGTIRSACWKLKEEGKLRVSGSPNASGAIEWSWYLSKQAKQQLPETKAAIGEVI